MNFRYVKKKNSFKLNAYNSAKNCNNSTLKIAISCRYFYWFK
jgi:hypothetical protein